MNIKIGALISGGGTNLQAIIDACKDGRIDGKMVFVGADKQADGLKRAQRATIPTFVVDYCSIIKKVQKGQYVLPEDFDLDEILDKQSFFDMEIFRARTELNRIENYFKSKAIAEAQLLKVMKQYPFNLLVLAGFMFNLTPYFIDRVNTPDRPWRIMNIHPALLPAHPGIDGYGDTWRFGNKVGGCTVHYIDYGEDSGPIIGQKSYDIFPLDTEEDIKKRGLELEWQLYPECIALHAAGMLYVVKRQQRDGSMRNVVEIKSK